MPNDIGHYLLDIIVDYVFLCFLFLHLILNNSFTALHFIFRIKILNGWRVPWSPSVILPTEVNIQLEKADLHGNFECLE